MTALNVLNDRVSVFSAELGAVAEVAPGAIVARALAAGSGVSLTTNALTNVTTITAAGGGGGGATGVIGGSNAGLTGSAPGGTKTASWTASELIFETNTGGTPYKASVLALAFNGAVTGVNGMDTGAMAVGDLAIYAVYNPTSGASATLGTVACNGLTYTGVNAPAGYTASALLWSGKVDSSVNIKEFYQVNRNVSVAVAYAFTGLSGSAALVSQSISAIVPPNAKTASGMMSAGSYGGSCLPTVASTASGVGAQYGSGSAAFIGNYQPALSFNDIPLATAQTLYWSSGNAGNTSCSLAISRYSI